MEKQQIYETLNRAYFSDDCDEKDILSWLAPTLAKAKCFVDVGASLGQYTRFASRQMTDGDIYAIEADPVRFEELERNCRKWSAESTNRLHAMHAAVSDKDGVIEFYTTDSNVSGGLFAHPVKSEGVAWRAIQVPSIRLDSYFRDRQTDLVKMDVEGGELRALRGATEILARKRTPFFVEVHSWADPGGQKNQFEVHEFMERAGYEKKSVKGKIFFSPREIGVAADPSQARGRITGPCSPGEPVPRKGLGGVIDWIGGKIGGPR